MDKKQIEREIAELKMDYINLQGDIEKFESVGQNRHLFRWNLFRLKEEFEFFSWGRLYGLVAIYWRRLSKDDIGGVPLV